ncbi:MAG: phosphotransferase, partial [Thioalkalispiraceae bacterium]
MSVYTTIERDELEAFLQHYPAGTLLRFEGISAGIENTNYFVDTDKNRLVLTIFEQLSKDELPYFLDLMAHLAEHDVPSAHPLADNQGHYLRELKDKPAALVQRLTGKSVEYPSVAQCAALGQALGHLHVVGQS